jgi:hypothetical protein
MVTQTTTTTAATTTVQPSIPSAITTTPTTTMASQRITGHLQTALWRTPGGTGGSGSTEGPTRPGGPAPAAAAPAVPAAAAPANRDDRLMGSLPQPYEGDQKLARTFLDQLVHYFRANAQVPGLNSAICKVSIALTLFQGQQTAAWEPGSTPWTQLTTTFTKYGPHSFKSSTTILQTLNYNNEPGLSSTGARCASPTLTNTSQTSKTWYDKPATPSVTRKP